MEIKGTITRAYVGEGLTGSNGRFNGKNVIHVRPEDPTLLQDLDGDHQVAGGELRIIVPHFPEDVESLVGTEFEGDLDETKKSLELKGPGAPTRRRSREGGSSEPT